jgi:hypothetical protein
VRRGLLFARPIDPACGAPKSARLYLAAAGGDQKNAIVSINPLAMIPTNISTTFQGFYVLHHPIPGGIMNI